MKKIIVTVLAVTTVLGVYAQKKNVLNAWNADKKFKQYSKCSDLQKGIDYINLAKDHEDTKNDAKTWYYRGNLYFNILATDNAECKKIDAKALDQCTESYMKTLVLNFKDAELKKLDLETEEGMTKFIQALMGGSEMEDAMYTADITRSRFPGLAGEFANRGIDKFQEKDFKGAQEDFGQSIGLGSFSGRIDTVVMYNLALASEYAKDWESAKQTYDALIMLKYNKDGAGPDMYRSMSRIYKTEGDTGKAMEYVKKGREAYPDNNNLIVDELEFYLQTGKSQEAINNLNTAIGNDPENPILHFAAGTVYEDLKETEKAVAAYQKALELDPKYFDAAYNLGAFYFNIGAEKVNEANKLNINATKEYEKLTKESEEAFNAAIPYVEKANEINPDDIDTANMLIKLYFKTNQFEKGKALKAKYQ